MPSFFNWQGLVGALLVGLMAGGFLGNQLVTRDVAKLAVRETTATVQRAWEERSLQIDREINLWNLVMASERKSAGLIELIERMDQVTGEAREALRVELRRRDGEIRRAQQDAAEMARQLRALKTEWGSQPVPDAYVCRMRGRTDCPGDTGSLALPVSGDRVAVRDPPADASGAPAVP